MGVWYDKEKFKKLKMFYVEDRKASTLIPLKENLFIQHLPCSLIRGCHTSDLNSFFRNHKTVNDSFKFLFFVIKVPTQNKSNVYGHILNLQFENLKRKLI